MNRIARFLVAVSLVSLASCATKPWMVGSLNDCVKCCGPFAKVPGGVWTKDVEIVTTSEPPTDGKGYVGPITK